MSFCPECGKSVGSLQKYCRNCGASLVEEPPAAVRPAHTPQTGVEFVAGALVCRTCGYPIKPGDTFCSQCLMKIPDDLAAAPAACQVPLPANLPLLPILPPQNTAKPITPTRAVSVPSGALVCRACGNPIKMGDKFCSNCLVKVPENPALAQIPTLVTDPAPAPGTPANGVLICRACGNPIKMGDKFCSNCLVKVPDRVTPMAAFSAPPAAAAQGGYVCASCGSPASRPVKFCGICGTPFVAAKPLASDPVPKAHPGGKFCSSCGAAISGTGKFCGSCGAAVNISLPGRL